MKNKADYNWPASATTYQTASGSNGYGLYDMAGNVSEWCNDRYDATYYNSSPGVNPTGPASGDGRVFRGGNWDRYAFQCRVASRNDGNEYGYAPGYSEGLSGFRVVLDFE